jgi:hypothetical protein
VELRTILLAKVLALCGFVFAFVTVSNAGSTLLFPAVALEDGHSASELFRFVFSHAGTMLLCGLWSFSTVLAITALLTALLPYSLLRRARRYTQFAGVIALIGLILTTPAVLKEIELLRTGIPSWAEWLPSTWFLGLYEVLGQHATGSFPALSFRSFGSTAAALLLAIVGYALSYRLFFLRSAEAVESVAPAFRIPEFAFRPLDATVLRNSYHGACFRFIVKTLARSDRHSAAFAAMLGVGTTVAVLNLIASGRWVYPIPVGALTAVLVAMYAVITALRVSFGVPSDPEANWIFRVTASPEVNPHNIVQRAMAIFAAPLVVVPTIVFAIAYDVSAALVHLIYASLCTTALIEAVTWDFRVLPFTCSWLPGTRNPVLGAMVWFAGLITFGQTLGGIEFFFLDKPVGMTVILLIGVMVLVVIRRSSRSTESIVWSDTRGELELLKISD